MKKILVAGIMVLSSLGMFACERQQENTTANEDEGVVVDRDSVATEYEVTETIVDYDTTTQTKTVDAEVENENNNDENN